MYVRWDPEDGTDAREFDFDPEDMLKSEGKLVEKHYGKSVEVWLNDLRTGSTAAREVLLWLLLVRNHKNIDFRDTPDFRKRQLKVEMSSKELTVLKERTSKMKWTDDEREQLERAFEIDIRDAMIREGNLHEGDVIDSTGTEVDIRPNG